MPHLYPPSAAELKQDEHHSSDAMATKPELKWVKIAHGSPAQLVMPSLVLKAVGIDHLIDDHAHALMVAAKDADSAMYHWRCFLEENRNWPNRPPPTPKPPSNAPPTIAIISLLALFFFHSGSWHTDNPWFLVGAIDSDLMSHHHQWWRLITALTLHADTGHLIGNCLLGGVIIHLLSNMFGYGASWLLLILGGSIGNLLNILIRSQPHLSVGLSTAIFTAIGVLTGSQLLRYKSQGLKELLVTLGAGAGLLAFLGSEGARTDLGAHGFGFLSGVPLGLLCQRMRLAAKVDQASLQFGLLLLAATLVVGAWIMAWHGYKG